MISVIQPTHSVRSSPLKATQLKRNIEPVNLMEDNLISFQITTKSKDENKTATKVPRERFDLLKEATKAKSSTSTTEKNIEDLTPIDITKENLTPDDEPKQYESSNSDQYNSSNSEQYKSSKPVQYKSSNQEQYKSSNPEQMTLQTFYEQLGSEDLSTAAPDDYMESLKLNTQERYHKHNNVKNFKVKRPRTIIRHTVPVPVHTHSHPVVHKSYYTTTTEDPYLTMLKEQIRTEMTKQSNTYEPDYDYSNYIDTGTPYPDYSRDTPELVVAEFLEVSI